MDTLVIAIDFGTACTGVAFAFSEMTKVSVTHRDRAAVDKVSVVKEWPGAGSRVEKIPSVLAYDTLPPAWGAKVKRNQEPRLSHFKLGLQANIGEYLKTASDSSSILGGYLTDHDWRHPLLPKKKAVDYTAEFLSCVLQYVLQEFIPRRYSQEFLRKHQISYVITVPAVWTDKAKELTRQGVFRSGLPYQQLTLITEPEAAALYCITLAREADLKVRDSFVVCDAGGGTVVCLLLFSILVMQ